MIQPVAIYSNKWFPILGNNFWDLHMSCSSWLVENVGFSIHFWYTPHLTEETDAAVKGGNFGNWMALGQVGYQEIGWNWVETILTKLSNSLVVKKAFHFDSVLSIGARARGGSVQRGRERFASRCLAWRFLAPGWHWESAKWPLGALIRSSPGCFGRKEICCNSHVWPWRPSTPFPKFSKTICDTTPSLGHGTATIDTFSRGFTRSQICTSDCFNKHNKPSKSPIPRVIQYTHGLLPWVFTNSLAPFPSFLGCL